MAILAKPIGILTPAYGRDYTTRDEMKKDFYKGLDFILNPPGAAYCCYISIRDYPANSEVQVRFNKLQSVAMLRT